MRSVERPVRLEQPSSLSRRCVERCLDCAPRLRSTLRSTRTAFVFAGLILATPALANSNLPPAYWADRQLPDARAEARAQTLMAELRCLVCQGQSIADSDAELAGDMRDLVRRRIAAGEKPAAVRGWLIGRYGSWISYRPTAEPAAWPLWLAPLGLLAAGALLVRRRVGRRTR